MLVETDFSWLEDDSWTRPATEEEVEEYNCDYMVTDECPEEARKAFFEFVKPRFDPITGRRIIK